MRSSTGDFQMPVVTDRPAHSTVRIPPTLTETTRATPRNLRAARRPFMCSVQYLYGTSERRAGGRRGPAGLAGAGVGSRTVARRGRPRRDVAAVPGAGR